MEIRFIDLFCGIGGFRLGLEKSNRQQQENPEASGCGDSVSDKGKQSNQSKEWGNYTCVWSNDNDKYACQIYRKHWGEVCERDIRTVNPLTIPEHDLLCAGFPCQSFSIAGKRGGFEDTRGTLFFEICRIARAKRTPYLLLENVKGLLSHDNGDTFQTIIGTLDELGYDCQWQVLNSKDFGVPQNRERGFIIGHLRGKPRPKVFPIGEANQVYPESSQELREQVSNTLRTNYGKASANETYVQEISTAIDANYGKGWLDHRQRTMIIGGLQEHQTPRSDGLSPCLPEAMGQGGGHTPILLTNQIRRLTPLECERLQGFPDNWTEGISDTQRYKCLGNAVTVNVIEAIGRQLLNG